MSPAGIYLPEQSKKQRELGFQFMNKSPRIVPAGTLKDFAYANVDGQLGIDKQNIDYIDNDSFTAVSNLANNAVKFHSIDSNYITQGASVDQGGPYNNKIFATSGPALVSPNQQQHYQSIKGKQYFNKNAHLMKGVLSQQRRFSRIISSN